MVDTLILALLIEAASTLILACVPFVHTFSSGKDSTARIVLVLAVVQAVRVLSCALLIAFTGAVVSPQEALLPVDNRDTAIVYINALTLADVTKAVPAFLNAFNPSQERCIPTDYRCVTIVLCDAITDALLIERCAF